MRQAELHGTLELLGSVVSKVSIKDMPFEEEPRCAVVIFERLASALNLDNCEQSCRVDPLPFSYVNDRVAHLCREPHNSPH